MTEDVNKKRALGRGLSALFGSDTEESFRGKEGDTPGVYEMEMKRIVPCTDQPRQYFDDEKLSELMISIRSKGVLQPILVRPHAQADGYYQIIAGERRYRAAYMLNLQTIPAIVKHVEDKERMEIALLENIQRQNLSAIEEAETYNTLIQKYEYNPNTLADMIGKSRSHVSNTLRLLTLPEESRKLLIEGKISAGHARAILASENPEELTQKIVTEGLSVRAAETGKKSGGHFSNAEKNEDLIALESYLTDLLGQTTELKSRGTGGEIKIYYKDPHELDLLIQKMNTLRQVDMIASGGS